MHVESCRQHLTAEERARAEADVAEWDRRGAAARDYEPACWSWQIPDDPFAWPPEEVVESLQIFGREPPPKDEWEALRHWQAGRCGACGGSSAADVLDHDHRTGMARGWLCVSCNLKEPGIGPDEPHYLARWRRRPAAAVLGVEFRYHSPIFGYDYGTEATKAADRAGARAAARALGDLWHRDRSATPPS